MVKDNLSHNLLEWASWEDQILTVIVFEKLDRADSQQVTWGTIFMSVYRRQGVKVDILYKKLDDIIEEIHQRY